MLEIYLILLDGKGPQKNFDFDISDFIGILLVFVRVLFKIDGYSSCQYRHPVINL